MLSTGSLSAPDIHIAVSVSVEGPEYRVEVRSGVSLGGGLGLREGVDGGRRLSEAESIPDYDLMAGVTIAPSLSEWSLRTVWLLTGQTNLEGSHEWYSTPPTVAK